MYFIFAGSATLPFPVMLAVCVMHKSATITLRLIHITLHVDGLVGIVVVGEDIHNGDLSLTSFYS